MATSSFGPEARLQPLAGCGEGALAGSLTLARASSVGTGWLCNECRATRRFMTHESQPESHCHSSPVPQTGEAEMNHLAPLNNSFED